MEFKLFKHILDLVYYYFLKKRINLIFFMIKCFNTNTSVKIYFEAIKHKYI
jgi:hypothetical protein